MHAHPPHLYHIAPRLSRPPLGSTRPACAATVQVQCGICTIIIGSFWNRYVKRFMGFWVWYRRGSPVGPGSASGVEAPRRPRQPSGGRHATGAPRRRMCPECRSATGSGPGA